MYQLTMQCGFNLNPATAKLIYLSVIITAAGEQGGHRHRQIGGSRGNLDTVAG